ncbi:hypothetical protein QMT40_002964 [Parvibaculaceae bacterium PLY_AMNH_Bact1]|nr:hypothetical protein QMT40_002964 [Parvibaculaceae bacterium PLY_AMNH_Bact1]
MAAAFGFAFALAGAAFFVAVFFAAAFTLVLAFGFALAFAADFVAFFALVFVFFVALAAMIAPSACWSGQHVVLGFGALNGSNRPEERFNRSAAYCPIYPYA